MPANLASIVNRFSRLRVLVIGDPILDVYLSGCAQRLSREAPVPNVLINEQRAVAGGAANAAANLRALGAQVEFAGCWGDDAAGAKLRALLLAQGISTQASVTDATLATRCKTRVLADGHLLLAYDEGTSSAQLNTTPATTSNRTVAYATATQTFITQIEKLWPQVDAVLLADYAEPGNGCIDTVLVERLARWRTSHSLPWLAIDSRQRLRYLSTLKPDIVKPNAQELASLIDTDSPLQSLPQALLQEKGDRRRAVVAQCAHELRQLCGAKLLAATLDVDGAVLAAEGSEPLTLAAQQCEQPAPAGAGDTYLATLLLSIASGASLASAASIAQSAAAIVVSKPGTSLCQRVELLQDLSPTPASSTPAERAGTVRPYQAKQVFSLTDLAALSASYQARGQTVVLTNGCFDLLHPGHIALLEQARQLGDVLIVAVNSDRSIKRLKGAQRPINNLRDRLSVLSALGCVDHVIEFDADTAHTVIQAVRPQFFVKGANWQGQALPEAALVTQLGGQLHFIERVPQRSTGQLLERIQHIEQVASTQHPLNHEVQGSTTHPSASTALTGAA